MQMLIHSNDAEEEEEGDAFLGFVEYARSMLLSSFSSLSEETAAEEEGQEDEEQRRNQPPWKWIVSRILKTCTAYSSGITSAILLSDLFQLSLQQYGVFGGSRATKSLGALKRTLQRSTPESKRSVPLGPLPLPNSRISKSQTYPEPGGTVLAWSEQQRAVTSKRRLEFMIHLRKKHRRMRLPNTTTIDSIYEKKFLSMNSILEAVVLDAYLLPGTNIYMLNLGDSWSSATIDLFLHRRYYDLVDPGHGILKKGREVFLTGCLLRDATEGSCHPRLLPTEYLVILLDENDDEDAMLLGAQFCSDSFSSISLEAVKDGASYSLYARIESIGSLEIHGKFGSIQRKEIILVDNDGVKLKFLLWGEQVVLAELFSVGSMLALDRPFVANATDGEFQLSDEVCLEYGSATQLYLVPLNQQEEQVFVASTQNQFQGSRLLNSLDQTQGLKVSQVLLPCDSHGLIDFSNYPFRSFVADLRDKMTGVSLYGVVKNISRVSNSVEVIFSLTIEDMTGAVTLKLHFVRAWSVGRLGLGHAVFISGLSSSINKQKMLEVSWFEKDVGSSFINLSCLPALLNSSCLHNLSYLSDLSSHMNKTHICRVRLNQIAYHNVNSRFSHALCGRFVNEKSYGLLECNFCCCTCDGEIIRTFYLQVTLADESAKVLAWCTGQTATELLQISPDEFYELPEDEQAMYLYTLENEKFMVAIVSCEVQADELNGVCQENNSTKWEIVRSLKCE